MSLCLASTLHPSALPDRCLHPTLQLHSWPAGASAASLLLSPSTWSQPGLHLPSSASCGPGATLPATASAEVLTARLAPCAGTQAEHCPGQWSYRVGPCQGVELADQLWLSRYILLRVSEVAGLVATLDPNPIPGAASSAPVRFSTRETREAGSGMREISAHMHKLSCAHLHHMMLYGQNSRRYSGEPLCFTGNSAGSAVTGAAGSVSCTRRGLD